MTTVPALATVGDNTIDAYVGARPHSFVGGNALNVAVQLAGLGHPVRYAGAVGPDASGRRIRRALVGVGVDVAGLVELPGVTSVSRIRVQTSGDRVIEFEDFAVCADYRPGAAELDALARAAFVHVGWTPYADEIRRELAARGTRVSQDCAVAAGYDHLDVAFCSAGEGRPEVVRSAAAEALAGGAALVVVTCGSDGSSATDGTSWWHQPAAPVEVVDTTGAGDSYIAGFLSARSQGADVAQAMAAGARTAAETCRHEGGWRQDDEDDRGTDEAPVGGGAQRSADVGG